MQLRLLAQLLPAVAVASLTSFLPLGFAVIKPTYAGGNKFFCTQEGNIPVTKVRTSRGPETFIRWVVQDFKKFPPSERCRIVSVRFQRYYDNGLLFITTRRNFNNYDVICIAHRQNVPCRAEDVLVTLKPGTDMTRVLQQILAFGRGGGQPVNLSGCHSTDEQGNLYIDVKQLVDGNECSQ